MFQSRGRDLLILKVCSASLRSRGGICFKGNYFLEGRGQRDRPKGCAPWDPKIISLDFHVITNSSPLDPDGNLYTPLPQAPRAILGDGETYIYVFRARSDRAIAPLSVIALKTGTLASGYLA